MDRDVPRSESETTTPVAPAITGPVMSTPRRARSAATRPAARSLPRAAISRAWPPSAQIQAATFAACPPAPTQVRAGVSVSSAIGPSGQTTTSRWASPSTQITRRRYPAAEAPRPRRRSARACRARAAPHHPREDKQDDDRPDEGAQHAAPVEDVGVADAEPDREDEVTEQRAQQAEPERDQPGHRPAHVPEGVVRNEYPGHDSAEQAEQDCSDHDNPLGIDRALPQLYGRHNRLKR